MDDVDRAFAQALAVENKDDLRRIQSRTFEAMFEMLFRVVKCAAGPATHQTMREEVLGHWNAASGTAADDDEVDEDGAGASQARAAALTAEQKRAHPLLPAALQGLSKYTHLIGVEYMQDLIHVLGRLSASALLSPGLRTHLLLTVSEVPVDLFLRRTLKALGQNPCPAASPHIQNHRIIIHITIL